MSTSITAPEAAPTAGGRRHAPPGLIVTVLCVGSLSASLMQSLVIPIQSELPRLLGASASTTSWIITATLLAAAVVMPVSGRLADIYGKKPVLVVSAVLLAIGSLLCAFGDTFLPVVIGRVFQGLAMGYVPVAISLAREVVPVRMQASAMAAISATLGVGGAIGLPLAAWIAQDYDWHTLFWISTGLAVVMGLLTVLVIPHVRDEHPARLDLVGALGLAVGLIAFLVGVSKGSTWGWTSGSTVGCLVGGVFALLLWGLYELRHPDPLVDLRVSARRPVLLTNLAAVLIGFGMMAQAIVIPQLLQMPAATGYGLGQSMLHAGLWMAPGGLMMMAFAPVSSTLLNKVGGRITLATGAAVLAVGYLVALMLTHSAWELMLATCIVSAGVGIGYAAMPALIMENVPMEEAGSGVGVNGLMRSVGTTTAGAVMAAILTSKTVQLAPGHPPIPAESSFHLCFLVGSAAAAAGALVALMIPRRGAGDAGARADADARVAEPAQA